MRIYIFVIFLIILSGCDRLACYEKTLPEIKQKTSYKQIMKSASFNLSKLRNRSNKLIFFDSTYIDSVLIDSAVFFNQKGNKCLLLILQKTTSDLRLDMIRIVQGTYLDKKWTFSADRVPLVPEIIYTIEKPGKGNRRINNDFETLSREGRLYILEKGNAEFNNCGVDCHYWFGE